jgi:peptidoglycan/xylan/chitin deacetylase (PgdA/CDA1 family)
LNRQPATSQKLEIFDSKRILEELTEQPVRYLAYPSGNYNQGTLELVKAAGYEAAFATIPRNLGDDPRFELERVGIYSPSLLKLHLKALGLAGSLRHMGVHVG